MRVIDDKGNEVSITREELRDINGSLNLAAGLWRKWAADPANADRAQVGLDEAERLDELGWRLAALPR